MHQSQLPLWLRLFLAVLLLHTGLVYYTWLRRVAMGYPYLARLMRPDMTSFPQKDRYMNAIVTEYNATMRNKLDLIVARQMTSRDDDVITFVQELMDLPSPRATKLVRQAAETPQSREALKLLGSERPGFFIECGALDGERSSNTLYLEQRLGWTGVLIEMDPYFYTQLRGKNRACYSINACLSPHDYITVMEFKESSGGGGQLADTGSGVTMATGAVRRRVPCLPLESILLALGRTRVDYFSLDVEGFELDILRTVPFERLEIGALSVEYAHGRSGKQAYRDFMEAQGYVTHRDIHHHDPDIALFVDDFIFFKQDLLLGAK